MKRILFLCIITVCVSCTPKLVEPAYTPPPTHKPTGKEPVMVIESQLILHPVKDIAAGDNGKNYNFFYDYGKRYLHMTDEDETAAAIRKFLPEYITADSIGRGVNLQSAAISPFSSFTDLVKDKITKTKGVDFSTINMYQFAKSFNVDLVRNNQGAMEALLKMLTPSETRGSFVSITPGRTPIYGVQGLLLNHPIKNMIKGVDGKEWYFFLDRTSHCIFITDDATLYQKIVAVLPIEAVYKNAVVMQGITIEPLVFFSDSTRTAMEKDQGLELNGGGSNTDNKTINNYDIAVIENCSMVIDYPGVITTLRKKLGVASRVTNTTAPTFGQKSFTTPGYVRPPSSSAIPLPPPPAKVDQDTQEYETPPPTNSNRRSKGNVPAPKKTGYTPPTTPPPSSSGRP
ncbi:MAG: hypothetical protein ABIO57_00730 [Candidatus Paceibacterota bacterium]